MRRFLVPVACALVQALSVVPGGGFDTSPAASAVASLVGLLSGLLLVRRDAAPAAALGGATVAYVVQAVLVGPVLPLVVVVAAYALARRALVRPDAGPGRAAVSTLAAAAVVVVAAPAVSGADVAAQYAILLLAAALAALLVAQREAREEAARRELVQAERLRLSRDLHDAVGHGMSAITVQAGAARLAVTAGDGAAAVGALAEIERAGRDVLREVRWLVTLLRDEVPRAGLAEVEDLVDGARRSGLAVRLAVNGDLAGVDGEVGEAAYRVVQEALTNVLRHAPGAEAEVTVTVDGDVSVSVQNDAPATDPAPAPAPRAGHGLAGMRERVVSLGGTLHTGPRTLGTGWSVSCRLPLRAAAR